MTQHILSEAFRIVNEYDEDESDYDSEKEEWEDDDSWDDSDDWDEESDDEFNIDDDDDYDEDDYESLVDIISMVEETSIIEAKKAMAKGRKWYKNCFGVMFFESGLFISFNIIPSDAEDRYYDRLSELVVNSEYS